MNKDKAAIFVEVDQAIKESRWNDAVTLLQPICADKDIDALGKLTFCLSQAREYSEAISVLTDLCERQPAERLWPYMLGFQYYQQEQWQDAVNWFDKALLMDKRIKRHALSIRPPFTGFSRMLRRRITRFVYSR